MITYFSTAIVGAVFLVTGVVKALSSEKFITTVFRYGLLPIKLVTPTAIAFIGIECMWGVALILHEFPSWLVPTSILSILILSALTTWSVSTGRSEDCGCYGGLFVIPPQNSILLNLAYVLLLDLAWFNPVPNYSTDNWQWVIALIALIIATGLAWQSKSKPLFDFSRLKAGKSWQSKWLKQNNINLDRGSHFIVFLSKDCPYCKRWVPLLNVMNTQQDFPDVLGILSMNPEEIAAFKAEHLTHFPLTQMDKLLFSYMVEGVPTAILLQDGSIVNKWIGEIPKEFFDRIKDFYENVVFNSGSFGTQAKAKQFGG
jgi:thioredoxin-related protein